MLYVIVSITKEELPKARYRCLSLYSNLEPLVHLLSSNIQIVKVEYF